MSFRADNFVSIDQRFIGDIELVSTPDILMPNVVLRHSSSSILITCSPPIWCPLAAVEHAYVL